jgi:hypothetical protein
LDDGVLVSLELLLLELVPLGEVTLFWLLLVVDGPGLLVSTALLLPPLLVLV